jgi:signal transduction histidine kinase/ActR/RegA family two-component response regulator
MGQARPAPRRSLRRKLLRIVLLATVAALLLSALALLLYDVGSYRADRAADLSSQGHLMAQSLAPTLAFDDAKAAGETLRTLALRPQIRAAAVFTVDGRPFARWHAEGEPDIALAGRDGTRFEAETLELAQPVSQGRDRVGTLVVRARHDIGGRMVASLLIVSLAGIASLGVALLIFRRLHPAVTRPLLAVAQTSRRIVEQRDYDVQVHETSDDEIGDLVDAFNAMLKALSSEMRERAAAETALRDADRRKDEFLATLAHELRNPLAPLRNALTILESSDDNAALRAQMRAMMQRQLAQLVRLIDDLLEVSRITRGKLELRREVVDLVAVVRGSLESCEALLKQREHAVTTLLPHEPQWVDADPTRLTQVFVNLLNNAARYTPQGGRIALEVRALPHGRVAVAVRDNGIGIEASQQHEIFEMFVQVNRGLEHGAGGLGLGLTIARRLVAMHGGTLAVHSGGLGQGATFTAEMPRVEAPGALPLAAPRASGDVPPVNVLLADDNIDFALSFSMLLRMDGHHVTVVHDGAAALSEAQAKKPELAFLDIGMPGLSGYELAPRLRELFGSEIELIAVTGWGQESDREKVRAAGFDRHLVKPIDIDAALALVVEFGKQRDLRGA